MPHFTYMDIINRITSGGWGRKHATIDEAEKSLVENPDRLAAFAFVELLHRFNKVAAAVGDSQSTSQLTLLKADEDDPVFPDVQVGDNLYTFDDSDGLCTYLVVSKDEDHHCFVVDLLYSNQTPLQPFVAGDNAKATPAEALLHQATLDIEYLAPRLKFAQAAVEAARSGDDISEYLKGYGLD